MKSIMSFVSSCLPMLVLVAIFSAIVPHNVVAQDANDTIEEEESGVLEEVIVTALRRGNMKLQDTPLAISALTGDFLDEQGFFDLAGVAGSLPGLQFQSEGEGSTRITIRGISSEVGVATATIYFDEMPVSTVGNTVAQPAFNFFDVERVEILRGPQGTLYGEGSMGGTIRYISRKPDPTAVSAAVEASGASINSGGESYSFNGMVNIPVVEDTFALRVSAFSQDDDGWIDNTRLGIENANWFKNKGARIAARWLPTDRFTVDASVLINDIEQGDSNELFMVGTLENGIPGMREEDYTQANLTLNYGTDRVDFISSTSYFDRTRDQQIGNPFLDLVYGPMFPPGTVIFTDVIDDTEILTQEFRLNSVGDSRFQWLVGVYYKDAKRQFDTALETKPSIGVSVFSGVLNDEYEEWAIFGEGTYWFTDKFQGTIGLRYFDEDKSGKSFFDYGIFLPGYTETAENTMGHSEVAPKLLFGYEVTDEAMIYASAAQGYRSGGFNLSTVVIPGAPETYEPDNVINYEFGWKTSWADNHVIFNGAIFYIDWTDMQVIGVTQGGFFGAIENVGGAHSSGVELELTAILAEGLELTFGGTYNEAELDTPVLDSATLGVIPAGNKLLLVPEVTFNASLAYTRPVSSTLNGWVRATWQYTGSRYGDLANTQELDAYNILNARIGVEADKWSVYLFADNLTDELAVYAPGTQGTLDTIIVNQPRTIGLKLSYRY